MTMIILLKNKCLDKTDDHKQFQDHINQTDKDLTMRTHIHTRQEEISVSLERTGK